MKKISVMAQVLDFLQLPRSRRRVAASATRPMSDYELAFAIRELQGLTADARTQQIRTSGVTTLRRLQHALSEEDFCAAERAHDLELRTLKLLRDPAPDTFLGRKTQEPFPNEDQP